MVFPSHTAAWAFFVAEVIFVVLLIAIGASWVWIGAAACFAVGSVWALGRAYLWTRRARR